MAQASVIVEFGKWAKINQAAGGDFRSQNKTPYRMYVLYAAAQPDDGPAQADIDAAWPINAGEYIQRIPEAGALDAWITFADQPPGRHPLVNSAITVIEP